MTKFIKGPVVAFAMYSKIPMPQVEWERDSMKLALCFFPLVGLPVGLAEWLWHTVALAVGLTSGLYAAVAAAIPILITGGIHLDGLIDTCDGLNSYGDEEKKLAILKDPHVGAFGVMMCVVYFLLQFGLWQQIYERPGLSAYGVVLSGFVMERAFSGLAVVTIPCAKSSGLAYAFADGAHKKTVTAVLIGFLAVCSGLMIWLWPWFGVLAAVGGGLIFAFCRRMCLRQFGGVTGDLCGYLLQCLELWFLLMAAVSGLLGG